MSKGVDQKTRILAVYNIIKEYGSEADSVSTGTIVEKLKARREGPITCKPDTLYDDMNCLERAGLIKVIGPKREGGASGRQNRCYVDRGAADINTFEGERKKIKLRACRTATVALQKEFSAAEFSRDGELVTASVPEDDLPRFMFRVASFGRSAEIVAPRSVRKAMARELRCALDMYENGREKGPER